MAAAPAAGGPADHTSVAPATPATAMTPNHEDNQGGILADWITLKLKLAAGWGHADGEITLPTSTTVAELQRALEARYGPFLELQLCLDAWPGGGGRAGHRTVLLHKREGYVSDLDDDDRTLATRGIWGRRHRTRDDAETEGSPRVHFLYCAFTPGPQDPLLLYDP